MNFSHFLNSKYLDLIKVSEDFKNQYRTSDPFPNISFKNFFNTKLLENVLNEFPNLEETNSNNYKSNVERNKFLAEGEKFYGDNTLNFLHFLNSEPFLKFLQNLTGIKETLVPDPYFVGGGLHETKKGGLLKLHADFNKHKLTNLDRRINILVYLNKNWKDEYGGHFELWDKNLSKCYHKISPIFNTLAIFSTDDFSYHGHPDPLNCPENLSRKSIALYYYSNGRPSSEINKGLENHSTLFVKRKGNLSDNKDFDKLNIKEIIKLFIPPIFIKLLKK